MAQKQIFQTDYRFESAREYIIAVGGIFLRRNKVFIISACAFLSTCITLIFLPLPIPGVRAADVVLVLLFICLLSLILSYILALIQLKNGRDMILNVPCTLTLYESFLTEQSLTTLKLDYSDIDRVVLTLDALAIISGDRAVFIPTKSLFDCRVSELLAYMLDKGANINGGTMKKAMFFDSLKSLFFDDDDDDE